MAGKNNVNKILEENKIIYGEGITLRPFSISDRADVFEYASNEETTKFLPWESHKNIIVSEKCIKEYYCARGCFAIEKESKCIGCIEIDVNEEKNGAIVGYVLNRNYWGQGIMTKALGMIIRLAFEKMHLDFVTADHMIENKASGRVMQKNGMVFCGLDEKKMEKDNKNHIFANYVIKREDFERQ